MKERQTIFLEHILGIDPLSGLEAISSNDEPLKVEFDGSAEDSSVDMFLPWSDHITTAFWPSPQFKQSGLKVRQRLEEVDPSLHILIAAQYDILNFPADVLRLEDEYAIVKFSSTSTADQIIIVQ